MKSLFHVIRTLRLQVACATTLTLGSCAVQALGVDEARHLHMRTAFGAAPHEIRQRLPLTREQAVDRLLDSLDAAPPLTPLPVVHPVLAGHYDDGEVE